MGMYMLGMVLGMYFNVVLGIKYMLGVVLGMYFMYDVGYWVCICWVWYWVCTCWVWCWVCTLCDGYVHAGYVHVGVLCM